MLYLFKSYCTSIRNPNAAFWKMCCRRLWEAAQTGMRRVWKHVYWVYVTQKSYKILMYATQQSFLWLRLWRLVFTGCSRRGRICHESIYHCAAVISDMSAIQYNVLSRNLGLLDYTFWIMRWWRYNYYQLELMLADNTQLNYACSTLACALQCVLGWSARLPTGMQRVELDALHRLSTAHYAVGRYRLQLYCYKDITFAAEFWSHDVSWVIRRRDTCPE